MYIKNAYIRMKKMQKNTWRFVSMCFAISYLYIVAAIVMLMLNDLPDVVFVRSAMEIASISQAVMLICAVGSVIIEEMLLYKWK